MKKHIYTFLICLGINLILLPYLANASAPLTFPLPANKSNQEAIAIETGIITFTPPSDWLLVDRQHFTPAVILMVVGKGQSSFRPSMNLTSQAYGGTLKQYLQKIKDINQTQGYEWKDLGKINTGAGPASLSQVDTQTKWGEVRQMHLVLLKNNTIYILTAAALRTEFSSYYKEFFNSMRSLKINKDVFESIPTPQRKKFLKTAYEKVKEQWTLLFAQATTESDDVNVDLRLIHKERLFESERFQNTAWHPFEELISKEFSDLGPQWKDLTLHNLKEELFKNESSS